MIENATIIRITVPNAPTRGGEVTYTPASGTLAIRCCQSRPTRSQRFALGAVITDATAVIRVLTRRLGTLSIAQNYQIEAKLDERTVQTYFVVHVIETVKPGLSNIVAFLRKT